MPNQAFQSASLARLSVRTTGTTASRRAPVHSAEHRHCPKLSEPPQLVRRIVATSGFVHRYCTGVAVNRPAAEPSTLGAAPSGRQSVNASSPVFAQL